MPSMMPSGIRVSISFRFPESMNSFMATSLEILARLAFRR
jgi:hypothetical protein